MPDMYRVRTVITGLSGAPWLNTLFFQENDVPGATNATAARDKAAAFWASIDGSMVNSLTITVSGEIDYIRETDGELLQSFAVADVVTSGGAAGEPLPVATQGVLRIGTATVLEGRRVRGKINVPGFVETSNSTGLAPNSTALTALNTAGALLLALPANPQLAVWHRPVVNDVGVVTRPGDSVPATSVTARSYWAILRSRRD